MKIRYQLCLAFLLFLFISQAQTRSCGTEEYMAEKMQDADFAHQWEADQANFKAYLQEYNSHRTNTQHRQSTINTIFIPVAVHYPEANESDRSCLEQLAQNQIDILNADYQATNTDANLWTNASSFYPGVVHGAAEFEFCIATQNHPSGLDNELTEGNPAVTIGYNFGGGNNVDSNWSGYFNIVVRNIGALGFSPLGGSVSQGYAVTMDDQAFGSGTGCSGSGIVPGAPYNLGRTTTHEVGHFLNLRHIWGNSGGCNDDDNIADTPVQSQPNYGCPSPGTQPGCVGGEYELSMNYMDYTNDACMYMYSQGQIDVQQAWVSFLQSQFNTNTINCGSTDPYFDIAAITEEAVFSCPDIGDDAVYEFNFSTYNGFNSLVDFSATGQPAGSTVSFSPASANADTTVTMTVSDIANTAQGSYTITVSATTSGFGNSVTQTITFDLSNNCTSIQCFTFSSEENLAIDIPDGIDANGTADSYGERILVPLALPEYASISSISVNVDVSHTYIQDLLIAVFHPDLTTYSILWGRDCDGEDGLDVTFADGAGAIVCADPTVGTYAPYQPLSIFNGMPTFVTADNVAEDWTTNDWALYISDGYLEDTGALNDWSIEICVEAALSNGGSDIAVNEVTVYPNPSSGVFNVEINSLNSSDVEISIYDLLGRAVFERNFDNSLNFNEAIDLSNAKSGVYMMTVTVGNQKVTKRIVIN